MIINTPKPFAYMECDTCKRKFTRGYEVVTKQGRATVWTYRCIGCKREKK